MSEITKRTRKLRRSLTKAETILWKKIRNKQLGLKFRRQYPIIYFENASRHCFIADFACLEKKIIIELDGKIHDFKKNYDESCSYIINRLGFRIIRFNNDTIYSNIDKVLFEVKAISQSPSP